MRLAEIERVTGASRLDIGNWLKRLTMTSDFPEVQPGAPRDYSYQNVVELAFIAAFVAAGLPPSTSVAFARPFVVSAQAPGVRIGESRAWTVFPAGDHRRAIATDQVDIDKLAASFDEGTPPTFTIVNTDKIFTRVDDLFNHAPP
ncbi:MAG: hypothetical protein PGN34_07565 [Methylobacterium frigidaeris]